MENYMKDNILKKTDELVEYIKKTPDYIKYQQLVEQVKKDDEIMSIINEVKNLQKTAVNKEYRKEDVAEINNKIKTNIEKLQTYPIYQEMTYLQEDLDNLFMTIKNMLDDYINKQIN